MTNRVYKGKNYKIVMEEIIKDYPNGYKVEREKETIKNKFLFWMKEYEIEVKPIGSGEGNRNQQKRRQNTSGQTILDIIDDKITTDDLIKQMGMKEEVFEEYETTTDVVRKIKEEVKKESEIKEKEKEKEIKLIKKNIIEELQELDVEKTIAESIVEELNEKELKSEKVMEIISKKSEKYIRIAKNMDLEKMEVIALIGPTGVGKTTTIAKLAGAMVYEKHKVAMITTDVYRIGAVKQLEIYADILDVEMHIANNTDELDKQIKDLRERGFEKILIDTVGRSPLDKEAIDDVHDDIKVAKPDSTSLVLSATQKSKDIEMIIKNFNNIKIDSLIFTKLDETTSHGIIINTINKSGIPLAYIANGQDVPDALYKAKEDEVAQKIFMGVTNFGSSVFAS